jgi:hypothetical protein
VSSGPERLAADLVIRRRVKELSPDLTRLPSLGLGVVRGGPAGGRNARTNGLLKALGVLLLSHEEAQGRTHR